MAVLKGFQEGNEEGSFGAGELNSVQLMCCNMRDVQVRQ